MVAPLIGAAARMLGKKFAKDSDNLLERAAKNKAKEEAKKKLPQKAAAGAGVTAVGAAEMAGNAKNKQIEKENKKYQESREADEELRREYRRAATAGGAAGGAASGPKQKAVRGLPPEAMKKGGSVEAKKMVKKELAFMKKKGAPKSMIKHEMKEAGMKKGMQAGGVSKKLPTAKQMGSMAMKAGGSVKRKADGVAKRGLTKGKMMRGGGMCK